MNLIAALESIVTNEAVDKVMDRVGAAVVSSGATSPAWFNGSTVSTVIAAATVIGAVALAFDKVLKVYFHWREHKANMRRLEAGYGIATDE